ncbi:MAG: hypothetical protein JJ863_27400 [Deltaproteobacteria bacterium]|nr:hypothetical protein [Deltaproteobacteria bacterium]
MLLEGQTLDHDRAAGGVRLWMVGLVGWLTVTVGNTALRWHLFSDSASYGSHELTEVISTCFRVLGIGSGAAIAVGAWRWVRAADRSPLTSGGAVVLGVEPLVDAIYWGLHLTRSDYDDYESRRHIYEALSHVWMVCALLSVAVFVLLYFRMARLSESQGWTLSPARVWAAVGAAGLWGLLVATARLEILPIGGLVGYTIDILSIALVAGGGLALLHAHRGHLRAGAIASSRPGASTSVEGLAAAGRGLGRYHAATMSQVAFLIPANLLMIGVARTGDVEAVRGLMTVILLIGFTIQLIAVSGLITFARRIPTHHAARGAADVAAGLQVINVVLNLVAMTMVFRAFSNGRYSVLRDLQDQLPILEGLAGLGACAAALAVLSAIERTHALGTESAGVLKAAIPALGGSVMVFKLLDHRDIGGPATLALAVALVIGLVVTAVAFLRRVRRAASAMQMPG